MNFIFNNLNQKKHRKNDSNWPQTFVFDAVAFPDNHVIVLVRRNCEFEHQELHLIHLYSFR